MSAHEGAAGSGRTILLAVLVGVLILCLVMCAYLLGRIIGGQNMSALTAISSLLVKTGVIPKEAEEALGSGGKLVGKTASKPSKPQRKKGHQTSSAESLSCPTEDPVVAADEDDTDTLDPIYVYDRAAGRGTLLSQAADAGDYAADGPLMVPTASGFVSARSPGDVAAAQAAIATPALATDLVPPPIPRATVAPPAGAAALPPPTIYTIELGYFLSDKAAGDFATELQKRGIDVTLVSETDAAGRAWTYVRSGHFTDSVQAFSYASDLSQNANISGQIVIEKSTPAPAAAAAPTPAAAAPAPAAAPAAKAPAPAAPTK